MPEKARSRLSNDIVGKGIFTAIFHTKTCCSLYWPRLRHLDHLLLEVSSETPTRLVDIFSCNENKSDNISSKLQFPDSNKIGSLEDDLPQHALLEMRRQ